MTHPPVRFDRTITAGHLLQLLLIGAGLVIWGLRLESQVGWHDKQFELIAREQDARFAVVSRQFLDVDARLNRQREDTKQHLARIESLLDRLDNKFDRINTQR